MNNNKKTAHIISHTHWDREWYINSPFVNEWLPPFFDELFAMMEKEPEYRFMLDGQISMLDDCYIELEKLGRSVDEFKAKVKKYAEQGRIVLGPYYLQPDWQLASEEALVRNMNFGRKMAQELGGGTTTGWLLDNFGQISQAPQIHSQFGMKGIVVWRGIGLEPEKLNSEFNWRSPDGTVLPCVYLLSSYRNAMRLADYPEIIYDRIRNEVEKIEPFTTTGNVVLMNGYDQEMYPDNILPYISGGKADFGDFTIRQSTPDEVMDAIIDGGKDFQQLSGPLYSGRYISVFPGILSARMYLKTENDRAQRQLEQYAEPLNLMCTLLGDEFPSDELECAWKILLKNHAHDSICGVGVDDVHTDMEERFAQTLAISEGLTAKAAGKLAAFADTTAFADASGVFTVLNTALRERTRTVFLPCGAGAVTVKSSDGTVLPSQLCVGGVLAAVPIPPLGYCSVGVCKAEACTPAASQNLSVENNIISVVFNEDGTLELTDKRSGRLYKNLGYLEECADSGDEYNYSFLTGDVPLTTLGQKAEIEVMESGALRTVVKISREWALPAALTESREARSGEKCAIPIATYVTIEHDSPVVKFRTALRNRCRDHRVRAMFPTDIKTEVSLANTQFDITPHPINPASFDNSAIPENVKRIIIGARESLPITQFPQREFVAVSDGKAGAAVINRGLPEYEVMPQNTTIALTLFRSIEWLTRFDLNTRIGDAGPEIFVPDAQCLRDMEFTYAFCPFEGAVENSGLVNLAHDMNMPAVVVKNTVHSGRGTRTSFMRLEGGANLSVTAVNRAMNGDGLIVRLYNAGETTQEAKLALPFGVKSASLTNLAELDMQPLAVSGESVSFTVKPKAICTVYCTASVCGDVNLRPQGDITICPQQAYSNSFDGYPLPELVTDECVRKMDVRACEIERKYGEKRAEHKAYQAELNTGAKTASQEKNEAILRMDAEALNRAALEGRLSAIFTKKKQDEQRLGRGSAEFQAKTEALTEELRGLAYKLNLARIDKRVSEYITDYYVRKEKDELERRG